MSLEALLTQGADWPPPHLAARWEAIGRYRDMFVGGEAAANQWAKRYRHRRQRADEFVAYPIAEVAVRTLATFLFSEPATMTSASAQDDLDDLVEANHLHQINMEAAVMACVDGEVYYKVDVDRAIDPRGIISVVPASQAVPIFAFGRLQEVAFVREVGGPTNASSQVLRHVEIRSQVLRHVEIRRRGEIAHRLFRGSTSKLGTEIDLAEVPATAELPALRPTGIDDSLVRHVPFWRAGGDHGISVLRGKEGLIDAIYGLYSQDQHDAEMSKKRVAMSEEYIQRDADNRVMFDRYTDVLALAPSAASALGSDTRPIHTIDFSDSTVMGQRIAQRLNEFLLACGIAPQSAGRDVVGGAESGTARKLAQALTLMTVATTGRYFTVALTDMLNLTLFDVEPKLLGRQNPGEADVQVLMRDGFIDDLVENTARVGAARQAGVMSTEQSVRELHPNWGETEVAAEVRLIAEEEGLRLPTLDDFGDEPDQPVQSTAPGEPVPT